MADQVKESFYVMMVDYAFLPATVGTFYKVYVGDWVIFENWGKTVHKIVGYAESPDLLPGEAYQVALNNSGVLKFQCDKSPNMECEIVVQEGQRET